MAKNGFYFKKNTRYTYAKQNSLRIVSVAVVHGAEFPDTLATNAFEIQGCANGIS